MGFSRTAQRRRIATNGTLALLTVLLLMGSLGPDFSEVAKGQVSFPNDSNNVTILVANGSGSFTPVQSFLFVTPPRLLVSGDFNGDGKQDLAFVTCAANPCLLNILRANGDGTFQQLPAAPMPTGTPAAMAARDFDLNGRADLVVGYATGRTFLFLADGQGPFNVMNSGSDDPHSAGLPPFAFWDPLTFCDYYGTEIGVINEGDFFVDIVVECGGYFFVIRHTPGGVFDIRPATLDDYIDLELNPSNFPPPSSPDLEALTTANGRNDVFALRNNGANAPGSIREYNNDGTGVFGNTPSNTLATQNDPVRIEAVDLNADTRADLAVLNRGPGTLSVFAANAPSAGYAAAVNFPAGSNPFDLSRATFNGKTGFVVATGDSSIASLINNTPNGGAPSFSTVISPCGGAGLADIEAAGTTPAGNAIAGTIGCRGVPATATATATRTSTPTASPTATLTPGPNTSTLNGVVTLQGRGNAPDPRWAVPLSVKFFQSGTNNVVVSTTVTCDTNGNFTVINLPPGTYDVEVKHSQALSRRASGVGFVAGTGTQRNFGTLLSGDINNDNVVSIQDFSVLSGSFTLAQGQAGYDPRADLAVNNIVDIQDFSLLASNFGLGGPGVASAP